MSAVMGEPPRRGGLGGAALIVSCGALALAALTTLINGASNNGALVTRVGTLENTANRIEHKVDDLSTEDGKIRVLEQQVHALDSEVADHEIRLRQSRR